MNVFELFGSLSLKADGFFSGLSEAGSALSSFAGKVGAVVDTAKKIDGVITGISDKAVSATTTFVTETFSIAKAIDENIMQVVDKAGETVIGAFQTMATEGVAFFKDVMQEGMSFDTAMGQVGATLLQTRDDMDTTTVSVDGFNGTLREFAKKMGAETMFTATQAAEALNYMALAGYDAQTSAEMLPKVLNLAAAGAMDLGTASDMVTDSQTALGLSIEDTSAMIDQMAKTASSSNTSVSQLGDAILAIGATGRQVKGGFTELNTVLGALADNGIKASESGNMLRRLLTNLTTAEGEAKEQLDKLGVSVFDAQGNMRDLPSIFLELDKAMSGLTDQERAKTISDIFGQYSLAGANALLKTSAKRWEELGEKIRESEGAAEAMADIQLDTLPGQIAILQSAFSGLKTELYEKAAPAAKDFVKMLSEGLSDVAKEITSGNYADALINLGSTAVQLVKKGITTILENSTTIDEIIYGAVEFIKKVGSALFEGGSKLLPELLKHLLFFAQGIITNFADFLSDEKNLTIIRETISNIFTQLETFFDKNRDNLYVIFSTLFDLGVEILEELFVLKRETIYSILSEKMLEIIEDLPEKIKSWLESDGLTETVDNILSFISELAQTLLDSSAEILPNLLRFALDIGNKIVTGLVDFLSDNENEGKIRAAIGQILASAEKFLEEHEDDFFTIADTVIDIILGFIPRIFVLRRKTTWDLVKREFKSIWSKGYEIYNQMREDTKKRMDDFFEGIQDITSTWLTETLPNKLKEWYDLTDFFEIYNQMSEDTKKEMDDFFNGIQDKTSHWLTVTLPNKLKEWYDLGTLKQAFIDGWQPIVDDAKNWGKDIIEGLWNGITNAKDWLIEQIGGFTDSVTNAFKDFFGIQSPSKVMRDEVGKFLAEGVGVGFTKEMDKVTEDMQKALPTSFDINADIVSKSAPTQSKIGGNILELHIENFYNNTQDDVRNFARGLYNEIFREKVAEF